MVLKRLHQIVCFSASFLKELLLFLEDQLLRLLGVRPCHASEKARQRSHWVGLSSLLLLLLPLGFLYKFITPTSSIDYLVYTTIGLSSLAGDYLFVDTSTYPNLSKHTAFMDNWAAFIAAFFNVVKLIYYIEAFDWRIGVCLTLTALALPLLYISRRITSQQGWVLAHSLWHLLATSITLFILEIQRIAFLKA